MPARRLAAALLAVAAALPSAALAYSGNPSAIAGLTPKGPTPGCTGCHGATATSSLSVTISGPLAIAAGASAVYTVTATRSGTVDGTKMGLAMAASPSPTALSVAAGMPMVLDDASGEVIHSAVVNPLRTTTGGSASYDVRFTMPAGTAPATAHTLYAVARLAGTNWQLASNFTVTTPPSNPATLTSPGKGATSVQLAWTGGGPQYRVVVKPGSTPPSSPTDGTAIDVGTSTSTAVPGLQPLTTYAFAVFSRTASVEAYSAGAATLVVTTTDLIAQLPISLYAGGNAAGDGGPVASAMIGAGRMARDTAGNLYIADDFNNRIRKVAAATGVITTVAGTGFSGFSGDGGPATQASFNRPAGVAVDAAGNLYILDRNNYRIRKVTAATGVITTIAGTGTAGYSGDGGAATAARIGNTYGIAVDGSGNVYFSDFARVRRVTPGGTISTYAGNGTLGGVTNNVPATSATLNQPEGLAVDASGNLYIADRNNFRVRKVTAATGIISTYAGSGSFPPTADSGPATSINIGTPAGVAFDASGNLLIADDIGYLVWRVTTATGNVALVAGTKSPFAGCEANGLGALSTCFARAIDVNVAPDGGILVMDDFRLRKVNPSTNVVSAYTSGTDPTLYTGDGGPAAAAFLYSANGLAMDAQDRLHITESGRPRVRRVDPATLAIATVGSYPTDTFLGLAGVAFSPGGTLVAAMKVRHAILEFPEGGTPGLYAGVYGSFADCFGAGENVIFYEPTGLWRDRQGRLLVVERATNCLRRLEIVNGVRNWTRIAGSGFSARGFAGDGGPATSAWLNYPTGIAEDRAGNLYIADAGNHRVRRVDATTGNIATIAGNGTAGFSGDGGAGTAASLNNPSAVAVDMAGNLYVADQDNHRVRKVGAATGMIATVAGNGTAGIAGDGGSAGLASLASPSGLAFDSLGNLYVANNGSGRVRKVATTASVQLSVTPPTGAFGDAVQLTATVTDGADVPAGTVIFRDGNDDLCTGQISGGVATCTTTALAAGAHTLGAVYGGGPASLAGRSLPVVRPVAKATQSIDFPPLADRTSASAPFTVTATVPTWGTTVTFSSLTPAVCATGGANGATVTILGAGTCTIAANAAGTANLEAAPQVQQSFAVAKGAQAISFTSTAPVAATVGGATYSVGATATSGLAVTFTIDASASAVCSIAGSTVSFTGVGTCVINANQAGNANFNAAAQVQQSFSVQATPGFVLGVSLAGAGTGSVASSPAGINCGPTCSATFNAGVTVTLTATPSAGSIFSGWSGGGCSGTGACVVTVTAATTVTATFGLSTRAPSLVNISTRMQVLTGDDVLIGGFIIGGSGPKTVVVRARGPSLIPLGVPNALANPRMDLYSGQTVIASNDDWQQAANASQIQSSGFAPSNALESAILVTLDPGGYTAVVSGVNNGTGVGIIEVFEVDRPEIPLVNISTRGRVLTGDDVMIGGFIIQGSAPQTVIVRARGPSLADFGIVTPLANPVLQLFSGQAVIATNDNWQTAPNAPTIQALGFAPQSPFESVIMITLNPGAYTAIVTGAGGTTGVGIIEVFAQ